MSGDSTLMRQPILFNAPYHQALHVRCSVQMANLALSDLSRIMLGFGWFTADVETLLP
jgi:hypothetical protein